MYSTPTEGFLPPRLMSWPAVPAHCLRRFAWPAVGWLLFLKRYAGAQQTFLKSVGRHPGWSHSSDGLKLIIECRRPGLQVHEAMRRVWARSAFLPADSEGIQEPACRNLLAWPLLLWSSHSSSPEVALPIPCERGVCCSSSLRLTLEDWSWKLLSVFESPCYQFIGAKVIKLINCMTSGGKL